MSKSVDDIWAALKAANGPRTREKAPLPAVQPVSKAPQDASSISNAPDTVQDISHVPSASFSNAAPPTSDAYSAFVAPIQRDINSLTDSDRSTRKRAISKLHDILLNDASKPPLEILQQVLSGPMCSPLVTMLSDVVEKCREHALSLLFAGSKRVQDFSKVMPGVVPALCQRMGIGQASVVEPSEEIRLELIKFVGHLVALSDQAAHAYTTDLAAMLVRGLEDPYQEVRKSSCSGIQTFCQSVPPDHLQSAAPSILDAALLCFHHPHSRVRSCALDALDTLLCHTPSSTQTISEKVVPALRTVVLDRVPAIRERALVALYRWLGGTCPDGTVTRVAKPADHMPHLLPMLLLGLTDEQPDIATRTLASVEALGDTFCATVLDADPPSARPPSSDASGSAPMDESSAAAGGGAAQAGSAAPDSAAASGGGDDEAAAVAAANLPAPFRGRASCGARRMVQAQLPLILPPVIKDIREWTVALRATASRSLHSTVTLAEAAVLPHLPVLLPALCNAVGDEEEVVALRIIGVAHIIGAFCEVRHWVPLLLDHVAASKPAPSQLASILVILAALVHAAAAARRAVDAELLRKLAAWLASEEVRAHDSAAVRRQLVAAVANVVDLAGAGAAAVAEQLYHVLLHLASLAHDEHMAREVAEAQSKLAEGCNVSHPDELAAMHAAALLAELLPRSTQWTADHPDIPSFTALLRSCPGATLAALGAPLCAALGAITADPERDDRLRMTLLRSVDAVLESDGQAVPFCAVHGAALLEGVLLPPLVWRAGKAAAAVRFDAITAICTLLAQRRVDGAALRPLLAERGQLVPLLVQCMDEDWYEDTRRCGSFAVACLVRVAGGCFTDELRRQVYPELNKRMDDSSNAVRVATAAAAAAFVEDAVPADYCDTNSGYFISGLLIHLDDGNAEVQQAVLEALQAVARKKGRVLRSEIQKVYENFRSKALLDRLLAACNT